MVEGSLLKAAYLGVVIISSVASGGNAVFQYNPREMEKVTTEIENQLLQETYSQVGALMSDMYNDAETMPNTDVSDLADSEQAEEVAEEVLDGFVEFDELKLALDHLVGAKKFNTYCRYGAYYTPLVFVIAAGVGLTTYFDLPEMAAIPLFLLSVGMALIGFALFGAFLWYRHKLYNLSDKYRRVA